MGLRGLLAGLVFLVAAAVYALLQGPGGAPFDITPLFVGAAAVAAGVVSTRRRPLATGLVLAGWGAAVLAVDHEIVPRDRTTPAYMLGIAIGLLGIAAVAPAASRGRWLTSGAIAAFLGPLGLYLAYDVAAFGRWPAWALTLVAMAGWELFWGLRPGIRRSAVAT